MTTRPKAIMMGNSNIAYLNLDTNRILFYWQ